MLNYDKYRTALYRYLAETPELRPYSQQLRSAKIIPIKGKYSPQEISYVSFNEMSIFVDETAAVSTPEYGILNTKILPKNTLERILGVDIVVIDSRYKKSLYDDKLEGILTSTATNAEKYRQLISELKCSRSQFNASLGVLLQNKNRVPLLTEDGEYHTEDVFITTLESGYFYGKLLNSHIASKEAMELAKLIGCRDISLVSYEDLGIRTQITADDIEDLQMPDIRYGYHILEQCIFEGFISEELIEKYGLSGIKRTDYTGVFDESDFPNEPVKNHNNLRSQIQSQSRSAREIIKVQELRTVDKVRLPNGKEQSVNSSEIRENTIKRYRPASNTDGCFCQMCRTVKSTEYIEVNNIWAQPKYYWPQMRMVNLKTTTVSYKVHKLIRKPEEEWSIVPNAQEAIIDENTWLRVQELRKNKRRPTATGKTSLFSGLVFCADCGSKLHFCAAKSLKVNQEFFRCANYKSGRGECTIHYIRNVALEQIVSVAVSDLADFVTCHESFFLQMIGKQQSAGKDQNIRSIKSDIAAGKHRIDEIDRLIAKLYEDNFAGKLSDERYSRMAAKYEKEQAGLLQSVSTKEKELAELERESVDIRLLLAGLREYSSMETLTPEVVNKIIKRIEVHNSEMVNGHKQVGVDIYFTGVGLVDLATIKEMLAIAESSRP